MIYRGHGLREVAYFFLAAADVAMRRAHERDIVNLYVDELERRGGYGHAASAQQRGRATTVASILENGVPDLLRRVVRDGRP